MWRSPEQLILVVPAFLLAITLHEAAHAWMAFRFGDPTARDHGRLTLNPLKHLDPMGTIVFFIAGFGWAKPVPVNPMNLRDPLKDGVWIAAAGPGANLVLATLSALLFRILFATDVLGLGGTAVAVASFLQMSLLINLLLAVFNMIPLHPLDGSKVVLGLLPDRWAVSYDQLNRVGPFLLLGLILMGRMTGHSILWRIIGPPVDFLRGILLYGMG